MTTKRQLAEQFLNEAFDIINKKEKVEGLATVWLTEIIELAYLNDFQELQKKAIALANNPNRRGNPLAGAITNIKTPIKRKPFQLKSKEELDRRYSYDNLFRSLNLSLNNHDKHLIINNLSKLEYALQTAKDDYELEMIACSAYIYGYHDVAQRMIENELANYKHRITTVKLVMCFEYFRNDELEKAHKLLEEFYPKHHPSSFTMFASGLLGHQPWVGYPFSDY